MSKDFDDIKNKWQSAKKEQSTSKVSAVELIELSKKKMKSVVNMHLANMGILIITFIGIVAFIVYLARFQETLSHIGVALMLGGLAIRIVIEGYSIYLSSAIDLSKSVQEVNEQYLGFYNYRKRIHGPVTITILVLYVIGYFLLLPEFNVYLSDTMMIFITVSLIPAAFIVGYSIKNGIKKEMGILTELMDTRDSLTIE
ncbi:hypothetical protein [Fulvivirga lutea]|uniref:Uncharacterized protein n=1 Tax=Fulvivirga lutea TaxID=2810512 RepID=A0A974WEI4_9BACT|nr:hypothetical protein [Fulvivirga lutea]QSE96631.1 hypothetical protein JR347_13635 [Fulvivirga lutea]